MTPKRRRKECASEFKTLADYVIPRNNWRMSLLLLLHDSRATFAPEEFTPVPSHGSIFVYMIPLQNVMPARVHPGCCTGERISLRYEISQRYHVQSTPSKTDTFGTGSKCPS